MPSVTVANNVSLLTAFKGHAPQVDKLVEDTVIRRSKILPMLPFIRIEEGFSLKKMENVTGQMGNPKFRALNQNYTATSHELRERLYGVKFLGDMISIEKKVEKQCPGTLADQIAMKLEGIASLVDDSFFNGDEDVDPLQFTGLKAYAADNANLRIGTGSDITINTSGTTFDAAMDRLDEAIRKVNGPNAIFMSDIIFDAWTSGARKKGANVLGTALDFLGQQVPGYRGIPFYQMGDNWAGNAILPATETIGGGTGGSSIFVCRIDKRSGIAGVSTSGVDVIPDSDALSLETVIDFDMGLKISTNSFIQACRFKAA